jgi:hypothetical protein
MLLDRTDWMPWLKYVVLVVGLVTAVLVAAVGHLPARAGRAVAALAVLMALAAPTAYSLSTAATAHTGSIPTAGPASAGGMGAPGGMPGGGAMPTMPGGTTGTTGATGDGTASAGGLLEASTPSAELTALLKADASAYTWVAAAVGSNSASGFQLATEEPVMAIGGFNGSDPSPTLAQFKTYVADGEIHYFIAGGGGLGGMGGGSDQGSGSQIASWVEDNFTATTVDGVTVYDLSSGIQ